MGGEWPESLGEPRPAWKRLRSMPKIVIGNFKTNDETLLATERLCVLVAVYEDAIAELVAELAQAVEELRGWQKWHNDNLK